MCTATISYDKNRKEINLLLSIIKKLGAVVSIDDTDDVEYDPDTVFSAMQGMVIKLSVEVGDTVAVGDPICVMEAMKMENNIEAEKAGVVTEILVEPGDAVAVGEGLMVIKPQ